MEEKTPHGYPLPHKDNIASEDAMRIREAIEKIDEDIQKSEEKESDMKQKLTTHIFEEKIGLWRSPYESE